MIKAFINKLFKKNSAGETKEGTVKFFNVHKGFGFIQYTDSDEEIFVHKSNVKKRIREKDQVLFEVEQGKKGPSAINVRLKE